MPRFSSYDGTEIAYRVLDARAGAGQPPLVCLAGGPGRDAAYLEDLAGLDTLRPLVIPDSRGTGDSQTAEDPSSYAFPRLAEDVEALRGHLGLERFALLAHSAGATTALAYAARHGERLSRLVLVAPGTRLLDQRTGDAQEIFRSRSDEPWYEEAQAALDELETVTDLTRVKELLFKVAPLSYGRWEQRQREHAATEGGQLRPVPRAGFWQGVDEGTRRAIVDRIGELDCPVLVISGDSDAATGVEAGGLIADCFPHSERAVISGAGHYPWVDEPEVFRETVARFLSGVTG